MSNAWSGFGLLFIATILQSTAFTFKAERLSRSQMPGRREDLLMSLAECGFAWIALVSALRVVVTPSRGTVPQCTFSEEILATFALIAWSSLVVRVRPKPVTKQSADVDPAEIPFPALYMIGMLGFVFSIGFVLELAYPWSGRIGMICFFEGLWVHVFLQVWFFRQLLIEFRYTIHDPRASGEVVMDKVGEDDSWWFFPPETFRLGQLVLLSSASLGIVIAMFFLGNRLAGGIVFWELWLLCSGAKALREEVAASRNTLHG